MSSNYMLENALGKYALKMNNLPHVTLQVVNANNKKQQKQQQQKQQQHQKVNLIT